MTDEQDFGEAIPDPLWFQVYNRKLNYANFVHRKNTGKLSYTQAISEYILLLLYQNDHYLPDDSHMLTSLSHIRTINDFSYFFFYYELTHQTDPIVFRGSSESFVTKLQTGESFGPELIRSWINSIISGLLPIPFVQFKEDRYDMLNLYQLISGLNYHQVLESYGFHIMFASQENLIKLAQTSLYFQGLISALTGKKLPDYCEEFRFNPSIFSKVLKLFWPAVLKSFELVAPLTSEEIKELRNVHNQLISKGSVSFLEHYVTNFISFFNETLPEIVEELKEGLKPSKQRDAKLFIKHFEECSLSESIHILPLSVPLTVNQKKNWEKKILEEGFERVLFSAMITQRKEFLTKYSSDDAILYNSSVFSTSESIFEFPMDQLVFVPDEKGHYVFTQAELSRHPNKNPYTGNKFPEDLFFKDYKSVSYTYADYWSTVLRRPIDLSNFQFPD